MEEGGGGGLIKLTQWSGRHCEKNREKRVLLTVTAGKYFYFYFLLLFFTFIFYFYFYFTFIFILILTGLGKSFAIK